MRLLRSSCSSFSAERGDVPLVQAREPELVPDLLKALERVPNAPAVLVRAAWLAEVHGRGWYNVSCLDKHKHPERVLKAF